MASLSEYYERIEKAKTKEELIRIKEELLEEYDDSDPDVKVLVKKLTR